MGNEPAYLKVYHGLKSEIQKGTYPVSGFLPKESRLEEMYHVSRTTVRKAVKMLSEEGFLKVRQGCGTIVCDYKTKQNYNGVSSVTESLRRKGYEVTTGNMMIDVIEASDILAEELEVPFRTKIARVQRLQLADGNPVTIMVNYIPYSLVPGIEGYYGKFVALYQFLEDTYQLKIDSTVDKISAVSADFMEAQILHVEPKEALLEIHRICYYEEKPVCVDHVRIIGSWYEVEIRGKGRCK